MPSWRACIFALAALLACGLVPLRAGNDFFLRVSTLAGESTASGHTGDIDLTGFSWSVASGGGVGSASAGTLNVTKRVDKASPVLMQSVFTATHYSTVTLFVRSQGANPLEFFKITLTDVVFLGYQNSATVADGGLNESLSMNFATIKFEYQPQNPDGTANGGPVSAGFNLTANKTL